MPKPRKDRIQRAEERGGNQKPSANGQRKLKKLEPLTEKHYQDMLQEWDRLVLVPSIWGGGLNLKLALSK